MAKGERKLGEVADKLDVLVEVRDARAPFSTSSPLMLGKSGLLRLKPVFLVLSKRDLADPDRTGVWLDNLRVGMSYTDVRAFDLRNDSVGSLISELLKLRPVHRSLRVGVVGIPNVGKSMFLNKLVGRSRAKVGGIPGITREVGWYKGSGFLVVDSPGILDPHSEPGAHQILSWLGCAKADVVGGYENAAVGLIRFLRARLLWDRVTDVWGGLPDSDDALEMVGRRLGCLVAGGVVNRELAARRFLESFASGKLAPVTLELPGEPIRAL
ncbi:ribosome biogenesis GTPase A [Synergistales bacterium]|nr:ribosome biogenesis GTPase A [Synergistales bacterium]